MNAAVMSAQVKLYAKELKMPGLAGAFEEVLRDGQKAGRSHLESLTACLAAEVASRTEHRLAARIKAARFPALKSFDSFDFSLLPSLAHSTQAERPFRSSRTPRSEATRLLF